MSPYAKPIEKYSEGIGSSSFAGTSKRKSSLASTRSRNDNSDVEEDEIAAPPTKRKRHGPVLSDVDSQSEEDSAVNVVPARLNKSRRRRLAPTISSDEEAGDDREEPKVDVESEDGIESDHDEHRPSLSRAGSRRSDDGVDLIRRPRSATPESDYEDEDEEVDVVSQRETTKSRKASSKAAKSSKKAAAKPKAASAKSKAGTTSATVRGKGKEKEVVPARDEGKIAAASIQEAKSSASSSKKPLKIGENEGPKEGVTKQDQSKSPTTPVTSTSAPGVQGDPASVPKRPKLPPIKKNKIPPTQSSSTPTSAGTPVNTNAPVEADVTRKAMEIAAATKSAKPLPRKPMGTDVDLSNSSIYAELFNKGSAPRGISKTQKDEERRKELNKMRDEARAKREAEFANTFDLQATWDKIARWETRFRRNPGSALYPNIIGGKFKDVYDVERRRERDLEYIQRHPA